MEARPTPLILRAISRAETIAGRSRPYGSDDRAKFLEGEPGRAWTNAGWIAVTEIADEIRLHLPVGEEGLVDAGIVETRHGTAIEAERPCRHDHVGALQR